MATPHVRLIPVSRCRRDGGTFVARDDRELAVFVAGNEVRVIDNACPHSGGNLSGGDVCDGVITCPLHRWRFDLSTGVCVDSPLARVRRYPARIEDGWVVVDVSAFV